MTQARRNLRCRTLANIVQSVKLPDGNIKVLVEGVERARAIFHRQRRRLLPRHGSPANARVEPPRQVEQTVQKITGLYEQFTSFRKASITTP